MKHDALHLLRPAEGAVVPLLNARQKAFLDLPREARVAGFLDPAFRIALRDGAGCTPAPVRLEWEGGAAADGPRPVYTVEVRRRPDGTPVFRADTVGTSVEVDNLEIARDYEWTVHANALGHGSATGTFRTEDRAPRLIRAEGIADVEMRLRGCVLAVPRGVSPGRATKLPCALRSRHDTGRGGGSSSVSRAFSPAVVARAIAPPEGMC